MLCSPQARVWDVEVGPEGGEGVTGRRRTLTAPHASSLESRGTSLQRWRGSPAACSCQSPDPSLLTVLLYIPHLGRLGVWPEEGERGAQPERGLRRGGRLRKAAGTHLLGSGQEGGPSLGKPFSSPTMHPLPASSSVCGTQGLSPLVAAPNRKHHRRPGSVETPTGRGDVLPCGKEPVARMKQCPSWCQHCKSENKVSR